MLVNSFSLGESIGMKQISWIAARNVDHSTVVVDWSKPNSSAVFIWPTPSIYSKAVYIQAEGNLLAFRIFIKGTHSLGCSCRSIKMSPLMQAYITLF